MTLKIGSPGSRKQSRLQNLCGPPDSGPRVRLQSGGSWQRHSSKYLYYQEVATQDMEASIVCEDYGGSRLYYDIIEEMATACGSYTRRRHRLYSVKSGEER